MTDSIHHCKEFNDKRVKNTVMDEANMSIKKAGQYIEELKKMIPLLTEDSKNPPSESIKENIQEINKYLNKILPEIQSF